MDTPILGGAYVARSVNAADNRMVNLFPELVPDGGKEAGFLSRAPGLRRLATIGTGPIRGLYAFGAYGYVVSGNELYRIDTDYTATLLGAVAGTGLVSMSDNGYQLFIAANPNGYVYNATTEVFSAITDTDFPGAVTVGFLDGYFIFNEPDSQKFWITSILEGTEIDALDFASAEGAPDDVVALAVDHRELWLFGNNSIEVWYDSGDALFPITRIQGAFIELGCAAAYSVAKLDNGLFWLGKDARGQGIVYRSNGYAPMRISTHAIEYALSQYGNLSDAIGYTYQQEGHSFYVLTFPDADATWVYDVATQGWHERASFSNGAFHRHRSNCQMAFNSEIIVGDFEDGRIYALDMGTYADDDLEQKWLRSWRAIPTGQNELKRTSQHTLQLDCESGTGIVTGQGEDPQVMLRWSDDGGHTWSNEHWAAMGKIGEYGKRVIWRRLGMTMKLRDRVYEVSGTDPVKMAIMGAQLFVTPTNG